MPEELYKHQESGFRIEDGVTDVFQGMENRAVPLYSEIQRMVAELAGDHALENTVVYDLGCSGGNSMIGMNTTVDPGIRFIGVDESEEMLEQCKSRLLELGFSRDYELRRVDLNKGISISDASVVLMVLTLQFVRPINREKLLHNIFDGLIPGGVLLLVEEILAEEDDFNRDFLKYYYNFKRRNNFSDAEITRKRAALENVLVPYRLSENIMLLKETGFSRIEVFFKWYNFAGLIAVKG